MIFYVEAMGVKEASVRFNRMGAAAINMEPAFLIISELMYEIEDEIFVSQGRRGGGSWKQLTDKWREYKYLHGLDTRINMATGMLWESVTHPNAEGQILEIFPDRMYFGSDLPQAGPSQKYRPFIKFTLGDRAKFRDVIRDMFLAAWKAEV